MLLGQTALEQQHWSKVKNKQKNTPLNTFWILSGFEHLEHPPSKRFNQPRSIPRAHQSKLGRSLRMNNLIPTFFPRKQNITFCFSCL